MTYRPDCLSVLCLQVAVEEGYDVQHPVNQTIVPEALRHTPERHAGCDERQRAEADVVEAAKQPISPVPGLNGIPRRCSALLHTWWDVSRSGHHPGSEGKFSEKCVLTDMCLE